ncbi:MAG: deoxyguanosinetriphosphate triphosphohydrolase [Clostridiales bacterium]|nr:MAG: deoxyguanosinetriphosphate triphosphohydrolase [Clostridiales bacterium]
MLLREIIYQREREMLSPYAMLCEQTRGRMVPISESDMRTEYMRDRDRIIHSKAFRRLKDKTQVFINPKGSHYRTRLTHTLEVAQISRTIARCLALNEDLTEAAALGHDLGHTPFGHAGEAAITQFYRENGINAQFLHNEQSLRVVDKLENGRGLNLTFEVRDAILNHKKSTTPVTLEGMAVNYADRIAYLNHDIDDALRAGIITVDDLPKECIEILGRRHSERINTMISDIVMHSLNQPVLQMSEEVNWATNRLREYMFSEVYVGSAAKEEEKKVKGVIFLLMEFYGKHPEQLPEAERKNIEQDGLAVCVADYIAGMTDRFAVMKFQELFVPQGWALL